MKVIEIAQRQQSFDMINIILNALLPIFLALKKISHLFDWKQVGYCDLKLTLNVEFKKSARTPRFNSKFFMEKDYC